MLRSLTTTLVAGVVLTLPAAAAGIVFELIPAGGSVSAAPGGTVGWGYRIENTSSSTIEFNNFSSDVFFNGTPLVLFDFPIIGPNSAVTMPWVSGVSGLLEFTWDSNATLSAINSGLFVIEGQFVGGGTETLSAAYQVTAGSPPIPEPGTLSLFGIGLGLAVTRRGARRSRG